MNNKNNKNKRTQLIIIAAFLIFLFVFAIIGDKVYSLPVEDRETWMRMFAIRGHEWWIN